MVLTLHIDKIAPGHYMAMLHADRVEVSEPGNYASIEEAIREEAQSIPVGFANFVEVRYAGVASGTQSLESLPGLAGAIADHLVSTLAEMHRVHEQ